MSDDKENAVEEVQALADRHRRAVELLRELLTPGLDICVPQFGKVMHAPVKPMCGKCWLCRTVALLRELGELP